MISKIVFMVIFSPTTGLLLQNIYPETSAMEAIAEDTPTDTVRSHAPFQETECAENTPIPLPPTDKAHSKNRRTESLDQIARLPPPGGTKLNFGILEILVWTHTVFQSIRNGRTFDFLSFHIVIDKDYDSIVHGNQTRFRYLVSRYLNVLFCDEFSVTNVDVRKGSVKISYNITRNSRIYPAKLPSNFSKSTISRNSGFKSQRRLVLKKRQALSSKVGEMSSIDTSKTKEHTVTMRETRLAVRFNLEAKYPEVAQGRIEEFGRHLLTQLARDIRVPLSSIKGFSITPGTTISFVLTVTNDDNNVMDERTVIEAANELKSRVRSKQLRLTDLNGHPLTPAGQPVTILEDENWDLSYAVLGVLVCVLSMIAILVVLAAMLVRKNTGKKLKRRSRTRTKAYRETAVQETGRDSMMSLSGRYSYDSGLWLGPGPEPSFIVPEAPYYRPPTADQLASTPRPATAVRSRLKRSWNIDTDQTLPPIPDGIENGWEEISVTPGNAKRSVSEPTY